MSWRRAGLALLVLLPLIGLLAFGITRDPRAIPSPLPGRQAPAFTLERMPADPAAEPIERVALDELRGNVVVLNFWASWCLACRDEHEALSQVATEYQDRPVRFFGIVYNDSPRNALRWIEEMGGQSYPSLLDPGSRTAIDYGLYGVPETFFIARDGSVARKVTGPVTARLLREEIARLLGPESEGPAVSGAPAEPVRAETGA